MQRTKTKEIERMWRKKYQLEKNREMKRMKIQEIERNEKKERAEDRKRREIENRIEKKENYYC